MSEEVEQALLTLARGEAMVEISTGFKKKGTHLKKSQMSVIVNSAIFEDLVQNRLEAIKIYYKAGESYEDIRDLR